MNKCGHIICSDELEPEYAEGVCFFKCDCVCHQLKGAYHEFNNNVCPKCLGRCEICTFNCGGACKKKE